MTGGAVGVIANPVAGRDIRRVAARGGVSTTQDKRNRIARAVVGAVAAGARRIVVMDEPFRIASAAVADLGLPAGVEVEIVDIAARLHPDDTRRAVVAMRERGVGALVVLGGDGTSRCVARTWPDVPLVAMSTGTNNVFPSAAEATVVGAAAGLVAAGRVGLSEVARRAKLLRVHGAGESVPGAEGWADGAGEAQPTATGEAALVDVVHLVGDLVGNRMPFDPAMLRQIVLTRAMPTAIGVSSVGGLTCPCGADDDHGVLVRCGPGGRRVHAPLAPGLYRPVPVLQAQPIALGQVVEIVGPGVLAFDGDRERRLGDGEVVAVRVTRQGPFVIDVAAAMRLAAARELFIDAHRPDGGLLVHDPIALAATRPAR
jgi:hypothetical protein